MKSTGLNNINLAFLSILSRKMKESISMDKAEYTILLVSKI